MLKRKICGDPKKNTPGSAALLPKACAGLGRLGERGRRQLGMPPPTALAGMMSELFVYKEDRWSPSLRRMAAALGRFIYTMDAYEDIQGDIKKKPV